MATHRSTRPKTALRVNVYADTDPAAYALFAPLGTKAQAAMLRRILAVALGEPGRAAAFAAIEQTATPEAHSPIPTTNRRSSVPGRDVLVPPTSPRRVEPDQEAPDTLPPTPAAAQPPSPSASGLWAAFSAGLEDSA